MSEPLKIEDDGRSMLIGIWFGLGLQIADLSVSDLRRHVPVEEPAPKREWKVGDKCGAARSYAWKSVSLAEGNIITIDKNEPRFLVRGKWSNRIVNDLWVSTEDLCDPEPEATTVAKVGVTTDPVKAIADKKVLTFRDRLLIAMVGGAWGNQSLIDSNLASIYYPKLLAVVDELIAEMAKP